MTNLETWQRQVNASLNDFPYRHRHRWTLQAETELYELLFRSLAGFKDDWLYLFFPKGLPLTPTGSANWSLRDAQGAIDGAEYLPTARGTACGHIFKSGESTYACKTCAVDDTCVLCTKCFEGSDHEGHQVYISISPGNSGCCDCGDKEAWKRDVICSIHTEHGEQSHGKDKAAEHKEYKSKTVSPELVACVRWTIARAMDYLCDVLSCSPEQMRQQKTVDSIRTDEKTSRLDQHVYGAQLQHHDEEIDYTLVLWNDEKHTVDDVKNQIARACKRPKSYGLQKAMEINDVGRSIVEYSPDVASLLQMASIIGQLKLTVTVRAARDTFREQMCATIIDWVSDISGCCVGNDGTLLRTVVCEELLKPWHVGSEAGNKNIAMHGLDDHEIEDNERDQWRARILWQDRLQPPVFLREDNAGDTEGDDPDAADMDEEAFDEADFFDDDDDDMDVDLEQIANAAMTDAGSMDIDFMDDDNDVTEVMEAAIAGYPAPPPPPPAPARASQRRVLTPNDSDEGETDTAQPSEAPFGGVPRTPKVKTPLKKSQKPSRHWLEKPDAFKGPRPAVPCEDLWQRVRLDWLILYDLRLWKTLRISLRHLYITTVIIIPQFKRILGLRFAGLYTPLAELYLIADREPDHSIINLSIQMLTTPTITEEVVERGNFLTNLMAILYTFLTTRQVGYPEEVNPKAVLAFDAGTVTNRRMFHFFLDLRWLFQSEYIQLRMRTEPRYLLQFLDLVKLHQGICPNVRATNEHVEYENDAWISASLIIKEVDKLCRQVAMSFAPKSDAGDGNSNLIQAVRTVAQVTLINSFGLERKRFSQAEIKAPLEFHTAVFTYGGSYKVPKHKVQTEHMSFHHPLHYLLSWLVENARALSWESFQSLLGFSVADLKDPHNNVRNAPSPPSGLSSEHLLSAILDQPLRVCAWLAQIKAGMWVRNGITLRHQANSYRSVALRDIGYQRNILMVQVGLVLMQAAGQQPGEMFLAQIIDRFEMVAWMNGDYAVVAGFEESQQMDVLEDLYHLLVIALSDRGNLAADAGDAYPSERILEHDIAHALCFKPLSFSELSSRVTEKVSESDNFSTVLARMTDYKAPEGLSDTGSFVLKPEYIELIDPYHAHYNRNLREEAENVYRKHMSRKTGQKVEDVVYEPRLTPITSGLFSDLAAFTRSELFVQICFAALYYAQSALQGSTTVPLTRIDTFLHMVLHLVQLAVVEDRQSSSRPSFTTLASLETMTLNSTKKTSLIKMLLTLSEASEYASCRATIRYILRKMLQRQPDKLAELMNESARNLDRAASGSPAAMSAEDKEKRKQEALARQARVMAQMKQQQNSFLMTQGIADLSDTDDDFEDVDENMSITQESEDQKHLWHYPTGTCILCQEITNDQRLYGTFAFMGESNILRTTPSNDSEFIKEVLEVPQSLDRPYEDRPFGFAGNNKWNIVKRTADGNITESTIQGLSRGFPQAENRVRGPVATSCGHIMHFSCFELYFNATQRRHAQQIARNHPETTELQEFICPLCKALGNTFLPIVWKAKECVGEVSPPRADAYHTWLRQQIVARGDGVGSSRQHDMDLTEEIVQKSKAYVSSNFIPTLISGMDDMTVDPNTSPTQRRYSLRPNFTAFQRLVRNARGEPHPDTAKPQTNDLFNAYMRLQQTVFANKLGVLLLDDPRPDDSLRLTIAANTLSRALGMSISAIEIAARGMSEHCGDTLLADLSEQNITNLRILSESFDSYLGVFMMRSGTKAEAEKAIANEQYALKRLLFTRSGDLKALYDAAKSTPATCMSLNVFLVYNDWLAYVSPSLDEALFGLQLCLWAEIVKVLTLCSKQLADYPIHIPEVVKIGPEIVAAHKALLKDIAHWLPSSDGAPLVSTTAEHCAKALQFLVPYVLVFLRKATILLHIRYGFEPSKSLRLERDSSELSRLIRALGMPSIEQMFLDYMNNKDLAMLTNCWLQATNYDTTMQQLPIGIAHPSIFELIGLPKNYDTLTEEAIKNRCPTTGKEITDPALCLFCGAIFCSQAVCCMDAEEHRGGCWQHMQKCGDGRIGMFINIRKCMVLFMHGRNGSFLQAPYLDRHGEPDPTLRRHHQLFLNQRRYDKLMREVWLNHGVQNVISRKLEADINPGGWETL